MTMLETERLSLRKFSTTDAEFIFKLLNEPSFIQNIGDRGVRSAPDAEGYLERGPLASYAKNGFGLLAVVSKETGEMMGMCGLIKREALDDVDIGYAFLPQFWSRGFAVEAARRVADSASENFGLARIVAIVDPANTASIRLLERIGFTYEKMVRLTADDIELKLFARRLKAD
ncbi:MAG TPA: GNAT family N-acetyltransferase [Anaerolineales bacterium]|jgi:ribosomal-protein-alanine N-acetyltransferase|nr:GNAT family N-acetyltransferase [Anaerolineales bacterium]HQX17578.1 GNAT family N-acetyltransferase [Anaerolineales bacterium]